MAKFELLIVTDLKSASLFLSDRLDNVAQESRAYMGLIPELVVGTPFIQRESRATSSQKIGVKRLNDRQGLNTRQESIRPCLFGLCGRQMWRARDKHQNRHDQTAVIYAYFHSSSRIANIR